MVQQGQAPEKALRAHTSTMVGNKMYVIGGCDRQGCYRGVATYNTGEGWPAFGRRGQANEIVLHQIRTYGRVYALLA